MFFCANNMARNQQNIFDNLELYDVFFMNFLVSFASLSNLDG